MKKFILFFTGLLIVITLNAQTYTYTYTYDVSGNRVKRTCITVLTKSSSANSETKSANNIDSLSEKLAGQSEEYQITVFPNPATTELILKVSGGKEEISGNISLFSLDGRFCKSLENLEKINTIDLSGLTPGNYFLKLQIGNIEKIYDIIKQ
jgi:hypothetical protein